MFSIVLLALQTHYINEEILDPRETKYVFVRVEDFQADMNMIMRRVEDLKDAPTLSDIKRIPGDRHTIRECLDFNRRYKEHLQAIQQLDLVYRYEIQELIYETDRLYAIWDLARDAKCEFYYIYVQRLAMKRLKEKVGWQLILPPYVPIHSFTEIK